MAISSGTRLGRYEILSPLGAGGMGEVYRARDERLTRDVAIKVLPPRLSTGPEHLRRFEQEARATGVLNHPNILVVHDIGLHDGSPYVVSELLEGETLRDRLCTGPLSLSKALDYGLQVSRGLAAAHDKGIVHRDLKPENLFITNDGRVKILDFGLAKLLQPSLARSSQSQAPTATPDVQTESGVIMGTVGYMSPEQVRGERVDSRSDIFSFGAVLYEMLTGERAFEGNSAIETMNAILKEEPAQLSRTDSNLSPALARIVGHCFEKNPQERFQSAHDLAFNLQALPATSGPSLVAQMPASQSSRWNRTVLWAVAGAIALVIGLAAWWALSRLWQPPLSRTVRINRLTDFAGLEEFPAISPDGKSVAFSADVDGKRQIWVRLLAGGPPLQITRDAADHLHPRWSRDASSLIYYVPPVGADSSGTIWEVSALGSSPRRITSSIGGFDLSHDGKRIAFFRFNSGQVELAVAARDGSSPQAIGPLSPAYVYSYPRWSPDDELLGYQRGRVFDFDLFVVAAKGGEPRSLLGDKSRLNGFTWTADGRGLIYSSARGTTIFYLPTFNLWTAQLDGSGARQLTFGETSYINPDVNGRGEVIASRVRMQFDIWKYPVDGSPVENVRRAEQITRQTGQVQTPSAGPGDKEIVYLSDSGGHGNLWVMRLDSGETRQITYEQDPTKPMGVPVWSPDGKHIAFVLRPPSGANYDLWLVDPDGSNLRKVEDGSGWATWSNDGRWLYFATQSEGMLEQLRKVSTEGGQPVIVRSENAVAPALAADGSAFYFVRSLSNVSGTADLEIHVARPENGPAQILARIPSSRIPAWQFIHPVISPDGKWLALPLTDAGVTNLWALSTSGGSLRQITDFGRRSTFIARRVSWSSDGKFIFAALGEGDADVVLLDGLEP